MSGFSIRNLGSSVRPVFLFDLEELDGGAGLLDESNQDARGGFVRLDDDLLSPDRGAEIVDFEGDMEWTIDEDMMKDC